MSALKHDARGFRTIREGQPTVMTGLRLDGMRELQMRGTGKCVEAELLLVKEGRDG